MNGRREARDAAAHDQNVCFNNSGFRHVEMISRVKEF
jgi:hypothetical protein